jgi:hypothetical protein
MRGSSSRVPRRIFCPTACLQYSPADATDDEIHILRSKLELHYGLLASKKPKLQDVWDSYEIFVELFFFQKQTKAKRDVISKEVFCLQVLVKRSTMFKTEIHMIRKNASHELMVKT